jgi:isocitrate dehydrogenase kinase/phosphatase
MFEKLIPYDAAHLILGEYMKYYHQYKHITKRAKIRFEHRDWHGIQQDLRDRVALYRDMVGSTTDQVLHLLGPRANDAATWRAMKLFYYEEVLNFNTRDIAETFYNSVFRHSHRGLSVDPELMFVLATGSYREFRSMVPIYHTFQLIEPYEHTLRQLIACYPFDAPFADLDRDLDYVVRVLRKRLAEEPYGVKDARIEIIKSIFFRNKAAYLVGRLVLGEKTRPFVLPLLHDENGIYIDTLLLEHNDVSSIFSYNRSYFMVDTDIAREKVDFLTTILPTKSLSEVYNSIGFEKHGKTVLYRAFLRHIQQTNEKFVFAPGIKGMVMSVFTLPSYGMVFKVIKDRFQPPKKVTEKEVKEKYELVSLHDRVGRMADSHMFQNFRCKKSWFSEEVLEELQQEAGSKLIIDGDNIEIEHLYIEKKMIPLNLYLDTVTPEEATEVINEYGKAIKQMAAVNIFPGDMLLKNFGVTRLKRVVFYDYDEIGFLTDYKFRYIPEPRDHYEEMSSEPFYSVGEHDVFPEEFPRFLIGRSDIRELFYKMHGDLYDVKFWVGVQERLRKGEMVDVFPYRQRLRFKKVFANQKKEI